MTTKTKVRVTFNHLQNYYGYMSNYDGTYQGGGFDWGEIYFFTKKGIDTYYRHEHTGYNNDLHGSGLAFSLAEDNTSTGYGWGAFYSPTKETFTLKSIDIASAWDAVQSVKFTSYRGNKIVANDYITIHITAQKVNFANYGDDFKDITKVRFGTNNKYSFNESSVYGKGWQIVLDNLKAVWNGKIPDAHRNTHHVAHGVLGALAGAAYDSTRAGVGSNSATVSPGGHHTDSGFHSAITSDALLGHHNAGLTSEFSLGGHF